MKVSRRITKHSTGKPSVKALIFLIKFQEKNGLSPLKKPVLNLLGLLLNKWESAQRDFLLGDADRFKGICDQDYETLERVLNQAQKNEIKIVLTFLSLPGSRWKQNNHGQDDLRIWQQEKYQEQATCFWQTLAERLKNHPAIVGYNILNEPHPELLWNVGDFRRIDFSEWKQKTTGSLADLN
ncbi:MAG: cellulase family glycosylhydrolase, partial [Simkania negevensis]|nr:cellulase family glycosylhydrolase [Simkania negevensis]